MKDGVGSLRKAVALRCQSPRAPRMRTKPMMPSQAIGNIGFNRRKKFHPLNFIIINQQARTLFVNISANNIIQDTCVLKVESLYKKYETYIRYKTFTFTN